MGLGFSSSAHEPGPLAVAARPVEFHVIGDALVDVIAAGLDSIPAWGEDADATAIRSSAGGSALNTAVHLAGLARASRGRCSVTFHGCTGADGFAHVLRARLQEAGVVDRLAALPHESTGSCVVLSGAAERAFVTCVGASGRISAEHAAGVQESLHRCRGGGRLHAHFGGVYAYGPLRQDLASLARAWREEAARVGVEFSVSLDVNGHDPHQVEGLPTALPAVDLFKGTEAEVAAAAACCGGEAAMEELVRGGLTVVATSGGKGATFASPEGSGRVEACKVSVQDTTGAGDACCAGILFARAALGRGWQEALEYGSAAGAVNCERLGGCSHPVTVEDVEALLGLRKDDASQSEEVASRAVGS